MRTETNILPSSQPICFCFGKILLFQFTILIIFSRMFLFPFFCKVIPSFMLTIIIGIVNDINLFT